MNLWEYDHPYRMEEGNFYKAGKEHYYSDWEDFIGEWGGEDVDLNRIHRWDFDKDDEEGTLTLNLYYVLQRKAILLSCHILITDDDQSRIREFLKPHAELNTKLWEGVLG